MKTIVTGGTGFVGSNIVKLLGEYHEYEVVCPTHTFAAPTDARYRTVSVDMLDDEQVASFVDAEQPAAIIHSAILNDYTLLHRDRELAWNAYVEATRRYVVAANRVGAHFVLVSTDFVFDGTQVGATESTPPNPVNLYGVLKMASEIVALEVGDSAAVARVSGVNGVHWARPQTPRRQDHGFGYFVASIVDALSDGRPFTVWEDPSINMRATPSLASECGEMMRRIVDGRHSGVFHCCGGGGVTRRELAIATVETFGLDDALLRFGAPDVPLDGTDRYPYDSTLDATQTAERLSYRLPDVPELLGAFKLQLETNQVRPL